MRTGTIYMHEFPNGKRYIGQTTQPLQKRFKNGKGYRNSPEVRDAIAEFGWHSVKTEILYRDIPIDELHRYETLCIDRWQTYIRGLNRDRGKDHISDETRQRLSKAKSNGKHPRGMFGKKHTDESRAKMSKAKSNQSAETRAKISKAHRGKKHTAESRAKMSKTHRGKKMSMESRAKMSESKQNMSAETRAKISQTKRRQHLEKRGQGTLF